MRIKLSPSVLILYLVALLPLGLLGQIDVTQLKKTYGKGEVTLKKRIKIAFEYQEKSDTYHAIVSHQYEKLYIEKNRANGLIQIPFNIYQEINMEKARYFKLDDTGEKTLIENVKVKFADTKDYFIENIFYNDLKVKQFQCNLDLPENYALSYSYEVIYKDLKFLSSFYFQQANEAVDDFEISIRKNANVSTALYEFNHDDRITKSEDDNYIKYRGKGLTRFQRKSNSVKGNYYLPHIILSVKSIKTPKRKEDVLSSTANIYKWYNSLIKTLRPDEAYMQQLVAPLIKQGSTDQAKISAIFKWVQNNVQYVAFEDGLAGFKPEAAKTVAKNKYGDCKGMANLLVGMLKAAGFEASHAWIGTRSKNYSYAIPSLSVDNHMICALDFEGKRYFLDATDKSASWDIPPPHLADKEVLTGKGENYEIEKIETSLPAENNISIAGRLDLKSSIPKVNLDIQLKGHFRKRYLAYMQYWPAANLKDVPYFLVKDYLQGIKVDNISSIQLNPDRVSFKISGTYLNFAKNRESVTVFPFLNLLNFKVLEADDVPTYIDFPYSVDVDLTVDENFTGKKEIILEPSKVGKENYYVDFSFDQSGGKYVVRQKVFINVLNSPLGDAKEWNEFISTAKSFNNYPIIYALGQ